ncbi:heavy metal-associated domain-containing protein [Aquimarina sp. I32.4]|uniref:heavy metal translocating P-type ATPase n=1 Tax=Aquimarina sp. I32.4 TaxID=2053903 RepID=UPI000CDEED49|nr:heavy metal-associated domain-containing protein [Aquimarina sp. I32.4]
MEYTYKISGMTCNGCRTSVEEKLSKVEGVHKVSVDLEKAEATIDMASGITISQLQKGLPEKFTILESFAQKTIPEIKAKTKLQQLQPLFIIFGYITITSILLHYKQWSISEAMLDFMGLFYIVFSFFKMLDLKGFPASFAMYDPIAKQIPIYGWVYPFIETALGIMFLMRIQIPIALVVTLVILGATTIGVVKTLMSKKTIQCACLGTALKLPMTEATFIENTIMIVMAIIMGIQLF